MKKHTGARTGRRIKRGEASTERLNLRVTPQLLDTLNELVEAYKKGYQTKVCSQADIITRAVYHYQNVLRDKIQERNAQLEQAANDFNNTMAKKLKQAELFNNL